MLLVRYLIQSSGCGKYMNCFFIFKCFGISLALKLKNFGESCIGDSLRTASRACFDPPMFYHEVKWFFI